MRITLKTLLISACILQGLGICDTAYAKKHSETVHVEVPPSKKCPFGENSWKGFCWERAHPLKISPVCPSPKERWGGFCWERRKPVSTPK